MAEDVQGLIVLTEGDRFVTIGRAGRARVWRIDLSGEPVDDVDRTGAARDVEVVHRVGSREVDYAHVRATCSCGWTGPAVTDVNQLMQHQEEHQEEVGGG